MLPNKWRFDTSQDWKVRRDDFDSVRLETILDTTLQALGFHYSPLGYLEEGAPRFVDVTDKRELAIKEPESDVQPITDSEDEKARKVSECAAKRKARCDNLCALMKKILAAGSATPSSPCLSMPALLSCSGSPTPSPSRLPMPGLSSRLPVPGLLSCSLVLSLSSRLPMLGLSSRPLMLGLSSGPPVPDSSSLLVPSISSSPMPALLSPLMPTLSSPPMPASSSHSVLGLAPTPLISSALRTFKRALSD